MKLYKISQDWYAQCTGSKQNVNYQEENNRNIDKTKWETTQKCRWWGKQTKICFIVVDLVFHNLPFQALKFCN